MKLYEFVDKLYAMGDMESPKTTKPKRTLNESINSRYEIRGYDPVDGSIDTKELLVKDKETKQVYHYIDLLKLVRRFSKQNGFEIDEQQVSEIIRKLVKELTQPDAEDIRDIIALFLMQEDDLDEGILGGLAGAAIGGLAGNSLGHPVLGAIGGGLAGSAIQNALNDDLDEEPESEEQLNEETEEVTEDKDLSTVKRSMTRVLQDNREKIDNCSTPQEVRDVVAGLLAEANMDTPATRKLLMNLDKSRSLTNSLQTVYNSILKGSGLGVC